MLFPVLLLTITRAVSDGLTLGAPAKLFDAGFPLQAAQTATRRKGFGRMLSHHPLSFLAHQVVVVAVDFQGRVPLFDTLEQLGLVQSPVNVIPKEPTIFVHSF
jgi:hypothetical protein